MTETANEWVLYKDRKPARHQLCDFLYNGSCTERHVWIFCNVVDSETLDFDEPDYWRPAKPLPDGIKYCDEVRINS